MNSRTNFSSGNYYVVAVSGGVDSVVLLHKLAKQPDLRLIVAHFDHGIRDDSADDERFVRGLAEVYGLAYVSESVRLGPDASEDTARKHRYDFLKRVMEEYDADAIVTAHHQDDLIETAAINLLRGTQRRGFISLRSTDQLMRPLLGLTKSEIREYVFSHNLEYVEDSTNINDKYLRNRVRAKLAVSLGSMERNQLINLLDEIRKLDDEIVQIVNEILIKLQYSIPREMFKGLDEEVAYELLAESLRKQNIQFDKHALARIYKGLQELNTKAQIDVTSNYYIELTRTHAVIKHRSSV